MKKSHRISAKSQALLAELVAQRNHFQLEHQRIHERADRECQALGDRSRAALTNLIAKIAQVEGIEASAAELILDLTYFEDHGEAFFKRIETPDASADPDDGYDYDHHALNPTIN